MIQDDFSKIPTRWLTASLASNICPSCGKFKPKAMTLCRPCWHQLDGTTARNLYHRIGNGYERAFARALHQLMVTTIHLPGGIQRVAPAAYADNNRGLHINIEEMLAILNTADTPENRDAAAKMVFDFVSAIYPEIKITEV